MLIGWLGTDSNNDAPYIASGLSPLINGLNYAPADLLSNAQEYPLIPASELPSGIEGSVLAPPTTTSTGTYFAITVPLWNNTDVAILLVDASLIGASADRAMIITNVAGVRIAAHSIYGVLVHYYPLASGAVDLALSALVEVY